MRAVLPLLSLCALPFAALADEVRDTLQSARAAQARGDLKTTGLQMALAPGARALAVFDSAP